MGPLPGGGVVFSDSSTYAIKVVGPDGAVGRVLTRPFRPAPVTDRILEAEIEHQLEVYARNLEARGQRSRIMSNARTGETVVGAMDDWMREAAAKVDACHPGCDARGRGGPGDTEPIDTEA